MPILKLDNLGQAGYMPDIEPSALPNNAFSYSRNFRFDPGGYTEISPGYHSAFINFDVQLGTTGTSATFMYTWLLSNLNAVVYYDENSRRLNLVETYQVDTTLAAAYTVGDSTLTLTDASLFPNAGRGTIGDIDSDTRDNFVWTAKSGNVLTLDTTGDITLARNHAIGETVHDLTELVQESQLSASQHEENIEHLWQATDAFGLPIFNNTEEHPWYYVETSGTASVEPLLNWPQRATCNFLQKTSAFLVAIGYTQVDANGAVIAGGPRTIAISDVIQTAGTLPTWGFNFGNTATATYQGYLQDGSIGDVTEGAGSFSQTFDLSIYSDGDLISAYEQNGVLYVNTTTNVVAFTYQGRGVWDATVLPFQGGALTNRSVTPIPNGFFHIGNNRMFIHDGSSDTTVGYAHWSQTWFDRVDFDRINEIQVLYDPRNESIKIKTPVAQDAQEIWVYNLSNNTLSVQDDHQEVQYMVFSADGVPGRQQAWDDFGDNITWNTIQEIHWNDFAVHGLGDFRNRILSVGGRSLFVHDSGGRYNNRDINAVLRREDVLFQETPYSRVQVRRTIPYVSGNSDFQMRLGGSNNPNTNISWINYQRYDTDTSLKLDWRFSTHWLAYEINVTGGDLRMSGLEFEGTEIGKR